MPLILATRRRSVLLPVPSAPSALADFVWPIPNPVPAKRPRRTLGRGAEPVTKT